MKLLVRGGSIPAGINIRKSYVDIISGELRISGIEVVNRSQIGDTSFEGVWNFRDDIEAFRPDFLCLHFGIDDMYRPVYRSEFRENLVQITRLSRELFNPRIFLLTSHPFVNPVEMDAARIYYRTIFEVAADLDCVYIPVHLWWYNYLHETGMRHDDLVQADCRYPNEAGHEVYADIVLRKIKQYIK